MDLSTKQRLLEIRNSLMLIDGFLDRIDEIDPYGDIVQNFEDYTRKRHTIRLVKMIDKDIKSGKI